MQRPASWKHFHGVSREMHEELNDGGDVSIFACLDPGLQHNNSLAREPEAIHKQGTNLDLETPAKLVLPNLRI